MNFGNQINNVPNNYIFMQFFRSYFDDKATIGRSRRYSTILQRVSDLRRSPQYNNNLYS